MKPLGDYSPAWVFTTPMKKGTVIMLVGSVPFIFQASHVVIILYLHKD